MEMKALMRVCAEDNHVNLLFLYDFQNAREQLTHFDYPFAVRRAPKFLLMNPSELFLRRSNQVLSQQIKVQASIHRVPGAHRVFDYMQQIQVGPVSLREISRIEQSLRFFRREV